MALEIVADAAEGNDTEQKRVPRPPQIDGLPVDEFIARNADPIWLHQNEMWELMTDDDEDWGLCWQQKRDPTPIVVFVVFAPTGAATYQPRARHSEPGERAAALGTCRSNIEALKGRSKKPCWLSGLKKSLELFDR